MDTYKIVRKFFRPDENGNHSEEIATGLTLEEAQEHCSDPETSWKTATSTAAEKRTESRGAWFDCYYKE